MHLQPYRRAGRALALLLAAAMLLVAPTGVAPTVAADAMPTNGIVCSTSASNTFSLTTNDGYIGLPDGNTIYMWGFSETGKPFQHPGPVLCVNEGQTVTVTLSNTLPQAVSIMFPGQSNVLANGAPAQPQFDGSGALTSFTNVAPATNGSVTYSFVAGSPGTYIYESGTDAGKQVQMGLFGALVVRPSLGAGYAYNRADSQFNPSTEYIMMLSEIDPALHQAVEGGAPFDAAGYRPRYWLINGRSFPDTIAPNGASWLPDQPYGALAHIHPLSAANPQPALVRYLSVGSVTYPFHPHGNSARVIGRDGQPMAGPGGEDLSYEKFSIPVGPGQTWDVLFNWTDVEGWKPGANPVPVTLPPQQDLTFGPYYGGSPYLGTPGSLPVGTESYNQCGEYYHVAHNHALNQITSWGVTMSGMLTYTRIDPPLPNNCPAQ